MTRSVISKLTTKSVLTNKSVLTSKTMQKEDSIDKISYNSNEFKTQEDEQIQDHEQNIEAEKDS